MAKLDMKALAKDLIASIREHVSDRLVPISSKLEAALTIQREMRSEIDELALKLDVAQTQIEELRERLTLRRVA